MINCTRSDSSFVLNPCKVFVWCVTVLLQGKRQLSCLCCHGEGEKAHSQINHLSDAQLLMIKEVGAVVSDVIRGR